jgi:hypothetical protein
MEEQAAFARISAILAERVGEARAITIDDLARAAGLVAGDRPLRRLVEHVLETRFEDFPFLLVSGAPGYWRPTDPAELNRYDASLQSRLVKLCLRRRTLRRKAPANGFVREGKRYTARADVRMWQPELAMVGG